MGFEYTDFRPQHNVDFAILFSFTHSSALCSPRRSLSTFYPTGPTESYLGYSGCMSIYCVCPRRTIRCPIKENKNTKTCVIRARPLPVFTFARRLDVGRCRYVKCFRTSGSVGFVLEYCLAKWAVENAANLYLFDLSSHWNAGTPRCYVFAA